MRRRQDIHVPAPRSWGDAPAPAEACTEVGFEVEEERAPRPRLGPVHGLERLLLAHPTAVTVAVLVVVGLAYWRTA